MPAVNAPQPPVEGSPRRTAPEKIQVSFATAVRRPESGQRNGRASLQAEAVCPPALPRDAVATEPDLFGICVRPQVINVPVGTVGRLKMVGEPGTETSGAVGAANVNVESGLKSQPAELADLDGRSFG